MERISNNNFYKEFLFKYLAFYASSNSNSVLLKKHLPKSGKKILL